MKAVAAFPEGPLCDVFGGELLHEFGGFEVGEQVLHLRGLADGFDGDLVEEGGFFVEQRGLFECGGLLEVVELAGGEGEEGLRFASLCGVAVGDVRIAISGRVFN